MSTSLSSEFRSGNGRKLKRNGTTVQSIVEFGVKDGDIVTLTRRRSSATRAQALKIAVDKGNLRANGVVIPSAAIWTHTSPEVVELSVIGRRARTLEVWNGWSFDGVDSSWVGNSGIVVESNGSDHTLHCSDGVGDPTFDDLIVTLSIRHG